MHRLLVLIIIMFIFLLISESFEQIEGFYPYDLYNMPPFAMRLYDGPYFFSGVSEDPFGEKHRYAPPYIF